MALSDGTRLGAFEILAQLGAGGMGEVYKARDLKLGRSVAIKLLRAEEALTSDRLRRFEQEARAASALNHPNIVTIHEIGEYQGAPYIAMEYVEGKTLREALANGPLSNDKLVRYATQMAEGLAKAHEAGIVHRDLKPENVVISNGGFVKILDFGLAKLLPDAMRVHSEVRTLDRVATREGVIVGTVFYMSPEQAAGGSVDFRSDQFALGAILYEMATGKRVFEREMAAQTLAAIIESTPGPVDRLNRGLPAPLVAVVERCLAKDPEERFASTDELAAALRAVPETAPPPRLAQRALWLVAALLAVGLAGMLLPEALRPWRSSLPESHAPAIEAVVVLPLQNLSGNPEEEYFADGMTEALITDLAKIGDLKVISRSSAMRYKGTTSPLAEVAGDLGVDAVVEGSAQRVGDRVRITAQLIEPKTARVLWGESYERAVTDVLRLEGELARTIASEIGARVTPEETERLSTYRAVAPEALEAYLKGVFHLQRMTPQDLETAFDLFQRAREIDPNYAAAYVGISQVWSFRTTEGLVTPREAAPRRLATLQKALELDPESSEAHAALAGLRMGYDWDWDGSEAEFRRAIELNPSNAEARAFHGHLLTLLGKTEEGFAEMNEALRLDPLNPFYQVLYAVQLNFAGRFDDSIARLQTTFAKTPGFGIGHVPLWNALDREGRHAEALEALKTYYAAEQSAPEIVEALEEGNGEGGYRRALRRAAQMLEARSRSTSIGKVNVANLYDKAGDLDKAFEWLERAYEERDPNLAYCAVIKFSDELRNDPRFDDLLERLNLTSVRSRR